MAASLLASILAWGVISLHQSASIRGLGPLIQLSRTISEGSPPCGPPMVVPQQPADAFSVFN